jgi:hypothetical protein
MMDLHATGHFIIEGTSSWSYDRDCAAPYFDNLLASGPAVSCTGNATNCASTNAPTTVPGAPAPDVHKNTPVINQAACDFWTGTALGISSVKQSYNQSVTVNGLNGKGNWTYTYTYNITANADPGAEHTCWNLDSSDTTNATLDFDARILGLSTMVQKGSTIPKASFTLTDAYGSRVQNLGYTLSDGSNNVVASGPLGHTIKVGTDYPDQGYFFGILYSANANAGVGNVAQLAQFHNRLVGDILNSDGFANNNTDKGGAATVHVADTDMVSLTIPAVGNYVLGISGNIKGNDGSVASGFNVTSSVCVNAGSCSACP